MWLDLNDCPERFHEFNRVDGVVVCVHSDGSICKEAEYDASELKEAA